MATPNKGQKTTRQKAVSDKPQDQQKDSTEWSGDLNSNRMEGQNIGPSSERNDLHANTAAGIDVLAGRLIDFSRDELSQIPIVPTGTKLKQGAVYLDMRIPASVPFTATADIKATEINHYAPKAEIPYELWNRLVAALGPAMLGGGSKGAQENKPFTPARAAQESAVEEAREGGPSGAKTSEPEIDDALADSFPASDPPSWTTGRENRKGAIGETAAEEFADLSDQQLHDKAGKLNIESSALTREQLILAIQSRLSGTDV